MDYGWSAAGEMRACFPTSAKKRQRWGHPHFLFLQELPRHPRLSRIATHPFFFCRERGAQNHVQQFLRIGGTADQLAVGCLQKLIRNSAVQELEQLVIETVDIQDSAGFVMQLKLAQVTISQNSSIVPY